MEESPVPELAADCSSCVGLCCVALPFTRSADFPVDKAAGEPCGHLRPDFRCGIHDRLRSSGYRGCTVFECFGAGQQVSRVTFRGRDWRAGEPGRMFDVFAVMRQLHELLWYVERALGLAAAAPVHPELRAASAATARLTRLDPGSLLALDVATHRGEVNGILRRASELSRAGLAGPDLAGADLVGRDLRGHHLRGANLRGALLVAADLRGIGLDRADVTGADLRDADLTGADLSSTLFLTRPQVDSAHGDVSTRLPPDLLRPAWWTR